MATIGERLTVSEAGWQRFNDGDKNITYDGTWTYCTNRITDEYQNDFHGSNVVDSKIKFNFKGTKLRILCETWRNFSDSVKISIDNQTHETFGTNVGYASTSNGYMILVYEKTGLQEEEHSVIITQSTTSQLYFDAIDIDENGMLKPYNININKYLIKSDNGIYTYKTYLEKLDSASKDNFQNKSCKDMSFLTKKQITIQEEAINIQDLEDGKLYTFPLKNEFYSSINDVNLE